MNGPLGVHYSDFPLKKNNESTFSGLYFAFENEIYEIQMLLKNKANVCIAPLTYIRTIKTFVRLDRL